jgi:hypothetical protein
LPIIRPTGDDEIRQALMPLHETGPWLLVVGSRLGASCGVPLPNRRTRWSPSVADLVHHWIFRSQSRDLFETVERALAQGSPPLGLVGDTLEQQRAWLAERTGGLVPHAAVVRLADLAAAGQFCAVATDASDGLLDAALARHGVASSPVGGIEAPGTGLPLLRMWDDRVFADVAGQCRRENALAARRLPGLLEGCAGVLAVGLGGAPTDLIRALDTALSQHPTLPLLSLEQPLGEQHGQPLAGLEARPNTVRISADLGHTLDLVAELRGVERSVARIEPEAQSWFREVMAAEYDIGPILIFIPGMALFSGLFPYIPKISARGAVSLAALLVLIFLGLQWRVHRAYWEQMQPIVEHIEQASRFLEDQPTVDGAIKAEGELDEAAILMERLTLPAASLTTLSALRTRLLLHYRDAGFAILGVRDHGVTPLLYLNRYRDMVESDPALRRLGHQPPLRVLEASAELVVAGQESDPRGIRYRGVPLAEYRIQESLEAFATQPRVALLSGSSLLLNVAMRKAQRRELDAGQMVIEIDFSSPIDAALETVVFDQVQVIAGYVGDRAPLYHPDGVIQRLNSGECSFYFTHLDGTGVAGSLAKIANLQARFPKCRSVVGAATRSTEIQLAEAAPDYTFLHLSHHDFGEAIRFLRAETSEEYTTEVIEDTLLRWSVSDPLILSLLVDYYRFMGVAPRSLGLLYDRLLYTMLDRGTYGFAPKSLVLSAVAHATYQHGGALSQETAIRMAAELVFVRDRDLVKASALIDELANDGVVRFRAGNIEFSDPRFRHLCVAKHLDALPSPERERFLLAADDEVIAFYAGLSDNSDPLMAALLRDYLTIDGLLRAEGEHTRLVNPFLPALRKAAWVVANGEVSAAHTHSLQRLLFELVDHRREVVAGEAELDLSSFSTAEVRRWVLSGIEEDSASDHRRITIAAKAPNDIYVGVIERWFRRLGTPKDGRQEERFGADGTLEYTAQVGVRDGFSVLAQVGTDDALALLVEVVAKAADERFSQADWQMIRRMAFTSLVSNRHFDRARPFLAAIQEDPAQWESVLPRLYTLDDEPTAAVLRAVLERPEEWTKEVGKYKEYAAFSLAMMRREVAFPQLESMLKDPVGEHDFRAYAAMSLGFRGDAGDEASVEALVDAVLADDAAWGTRDQQKRMRRYTQVVNQGLSYFTTPAAFGVFEKVWADERWRDNGSGLLRSLRFYRNPEAERFVEQNLLCDAETRYDGYLITALGDLGTPSARELRNRLIQVVHGRPSEAWLSQVCETEEGATAGVAKLATWDAGKLESLALALLAIGAERDAPRFAQWALHPERNMRRAAVGALGSFSDPSAATAILASMERFDGGYDHLRALERQELPENEGALLALFGAEDADHARIASALRRSGGPATLHALYARQDEARVGGHAAQAVYLIGRRHLAELDPAALVVTVAETLAAQDRRR